MPSGSHKPGLFPALLKYWRGLRGLSQLDLALAADVSSRHISFLETGRSAPGEQMVMRLAAALDVPLRHVNAMMQAAGYEPVYPEAQTQQALPDEITKALEIMKEHHNPFPLIMINRKYDIIDLNAGAFALFETLFPGLVEMASSMNLMRLTFDPKGAQPALSNFNELGRAFLWRVQREVLADPDDTSLRELLDEVLAMPTVPDDWRQADLTIPASPTLLVHLRAGEQTLKFVTMVTVFQAPQTVQLDELRIETWFPSDPTTTEICHQLMSGMLDEGSSVIL